MEPDTPGQLLDSTAILDRVGGDVEFLEEIAALFAEDCPKLLADIRSAIDAGNSGKVERAAHTLKGSVANFGAEPAREAALRLEMLGRSGDLRPAPEAYAVLEREIERSTAALLALARQLKAA
ncbi:MAG TPA: Hpt domain-containing protein [Bryobacteraceae bacterium]|nr:Hpt domain-containing protein [Bryobacteraceae bacterium]